MALSVLDAGSATAEAAPSVSRFAGKYVGADPHGYRDSWTVTISDGGRIAGEVSRGKGSISGRVSADGSYSFTVSVQGWSIAEWGPKLAWSRYDSAGNMALDAAGNIAGTEVTSPQLPSGSGPFFWLRQ
jgi:hypothetical protein